MSVYRILSSTHSSIRSACLLAAATCVLTLVAAPSHADEYDATIKDIELSDKTALPPKVKSLISLAVAAQIPCNYCIWSDTQDAKRAGATDEEIQEAVSMAALTRHWSTIFNGMQVDFETFKKEMGGE
jgi:AhpD family alkylhydroperoxidase